MIDRPTFARRLALAALAASLTGSASAAPGGLTLDAERLPDFQPGSADKVEMTEQDWDNWRRKHENAFKRAVRSGNVAGASGNELRRGAKFYADALTYPGVVNKLPDLVDEILTQTDTFADGEVKELLLEEFANNLLPMLYHDKAIVRLNAVRALARLNYNPGAAVGGRAPAPYWPVYRALLSVVEDPKRTPAEKVLAVDGLQRIAEDSDIDRRDLDAIIKRGSAALEALTDPANVPQGGPDKDFWWVPYRLATLMGSVNSPLTLNRQPLPVEALVKIAADEQQHWVVRAASVRAISELRLEDEGRFDVAAMARLATGVASKMAVAYNANPKDSRWRQAFWDLYFAFKPRTKEQFDAGSGFLAKVQDGAFRKHSAAVNEAFEPVKALMAAIAPMDPVAMKPLPQEVTSALADFAAANPPTAVHPSIAAVTP